MVYFGKDGQLVGTYNKPGFLKEYEGWIVSYQRVLDADQLNVSDLLRFKNLDI